jgi:hypothetical protein
MAGNFESRESRPKYLCYQILRWRRAQSAANPSLVQNSLLTGKIQGISQFRHPIRHTEELKMPAIPPLSRANSLSRRTGNFPTGTGKDWPLSGNFAARSGKSRLRRSRPSSFNDPPPQWRPGASASFRRVLVTTCSRLSSNEVGKPLSSASTLSAGSPTSLPRPLVRRGRVGRTPLPSARAPIGISGVHSPRRFTLVALNGGFAPHCRRSDVRDLTGQSDPQRPFVTAPARWSDR